MRPGGEAQDPSPSPLNSQKIYFWPEPWKSLPFCLLFAGLPFWNLPQSLCWVLAL